MDRRSPLIVLLGTLTTLTVGCLERGDGSGSTPTEDPFPDEIDSGKRGGAETTVSRTIETEGDYADGSLDCAKAVHPAVRSHIEEELDDLSDINTGYGRGPDEFDGMVVSVSLTTATYNRDGELIEESDVEFETVVSATPSTAYLQTEDGERVCAVPVYVTKHEMHVD